MTILELKYKCEKYIQGSIRVGGSKAAVEITNKLIIRYKMLFGPEACQIIKLEDESLFSIFSAEEDENEIRLYGYIFTQEEEIPCCICVSPSSEIFQSALIKMLFCIKNIQLCSLFIE